MGESKEPLYYCDPEKNVECSKRGCFYANGQFPLCKRTSNPAYAKTDADGKPMEAPYKFDTLPEPVQVSNDATQEDMDRF